MKKIIAVVLTLSGLLTIATRACAQDPAVKDIAWDTEKRELSYILSQDAIVKIRAGRESGPVYETLVNLEERKAGSHKETWSGKDPQGIIDFIKFGHPHFCVDPVPKPEKDLELLADLPLGMTSIKGAITVKENFSLKIDVDKTEREKFIKMGFEVRTFVDGGLIKADNAKDLPYTLKLDLATISPGEHLLSINIWPLPERSKVAYKNMLISYGDEERLISNIAADKEDAFFPSGIAFCQCVDDYWQIYVADLDGSSSQRLTTSPLDKSSPAFSYDGKSVAYATNTGELWVFNRGNKAERKIPLPVNCAEAHFSPDSKTLVFTSYQDLYHGDTELWMLGMQDYSLNKIMNRPFLQYNPVFSPDGNSIIFVDGPELYGQEIRRLNLKTKDVTQLTENGPYDYDMQPCFSPDGENIFYSSSQGESGNYNIWVMDKFGQNPHNLTKNPADNKAPQVTKDGNSIYFLSDRSGNVQIWRMDVDGRNPKQITNAETDLRGLSVFTR